MSDDVEILIIQWGQGCSLINTKKIFPKSFSPRFVKTKQKSDFLLQISISSYFSQFFEHQKLVY